MARKLSTTIGLDPVMLDQLQEARYKLKKSQSLIVREALEDYFKKHGIKVTERGDERVETIHVG